MTGFEWPSISRFLPRDMEIDGTRQAIPYRSSGFPAMRLVTPMSKTVVCDVMVNKFHVVSESILVPLNS